MELDSQETAQKKSGGGRWSWTLKREPRRYQEEGGGAGLSRESPGEIKSKEVELDFHNRMVYLAAKLFLNSCFSDTVFVTLLCTAVEKAISGVRKLLGTGRGPTSLTSLFWRWLTLSSIFAGRSARTSYSSHPLPPPPPPLSPSLIRRVVSVDVKHHVSFPTE